MAKVAAMYKVATTITYYDAGEGAVHFMVEGSRTYTALDEGTDSIKMKNLGIVISDFLRGKARKK
jgi:hypothetical protein